MARTADPERHAERRETITTVAAEIFARRGFERTTATDIARAAGFSSGTVFYYFGDKRAVFRSIFERDLPRYRELIERNTASADPMCSILAIVDELASEAIDPLAHRMLVELLRQIDHDPELVRVVTQNTSVVREGLATLIRRGIRAGAINPELSPPETAAWIHTIVDAAFLNADSSTDPRPMLRHIVTGLLFTPPVPTGLRGDNAP